MGGHLGERTIEDVLEGREQGKDSVKRVALWLGKQLLVFHPDKRSK